jgi:hypothetical protein
VCTHLTKRNSRYYIRRKIPAELQVHFGRKEVVKALGTADPAEARRVCHIEGALHCWDCAADGLGMDTVRLHNVPTARRANQTVYCLPAECAPHLALPFA